MRRALAPILLALVACHAPAKQALPAEPAKRQLDLSERIFGLLPKAAKADGPTRADAALALAEVVVPGYAPRLRLLVSGDDPILAGGAAVALVRIRLLRAPGRETLEECVHAETNPLVRSGCARLLEPPAAPTPTPIDALRQRLESSDVEQRRSALRELLLAPADALWDEAITAALVHRLDDTDLRVRLLTDAAFLRRSLRENAPP